jgi:hypothetical protein
MHVSGAGEKDSGNYSCRTEPPDALGTTAVITVGGKIKSRSNPMLFVTYTVYSRCKRGSEMLVCYLPQHCSTIFNINNKSQIKTYHI